MTAEREIFLVLAKGVLGLRTNVAGFNWSYGTNVPPATHKEYEACAVRLTLRVGQVQPPREIQSHGKYHYFSGEPGADGLYYQRHFLLHAQLQLEAKGLLSEEPCLSVNKTYYRFISHRFMNLHSVGYILTDLAGLLLLRHGYAPLHCSAFRKGNSTIVIFAPPNTGKTLATMMACMENGAEFLAEDLAITDGTTVYSVPWTSTFRYYSQVDRSFVSRTVNALTRLFPPLELLPIAKPKPVNAYVASNKLPDKSRITHLAILERGPVSVQQENQEEAFRKITNLNRYEFNYHKAPLIVAYEFFNPALNIEAACKAEQDILKALVTNVRERLLVRTDDAKKYSSLILGALK